MGRTWRPDLGQGPRVGQVMYTALPTPEGIHKPVRPEYTRAQLGRSPETRVLRAACGESKERELQGTWWTRAGD